MPENGFPLQHRLVRPSCFMLQRLNRLFAIFSSHFPGSCHPSLTPPPSPTCGNNIYFQHSCCFFWCKMFSLLFILHQNVYFPNSFTMLSFPKFAGLSLLFYACKTKLLFVHTASQPETTIRSDDQPPTMRSNQMSFVTKEQKNFVLRALRS